MAIYGNGVLTTGTKTSELIRYLKEHLERHGDTEILYQVHEGSNKFIRFYHFKDDDPNCFYILSDFK